MKRSGLFLLAVAAMVFCAGRAWARCCASEQDCPRGFACTISHDADGGIYGMCDSDFVSCVCDADCGPGLHCLAGARTLCLGTASGGAQNCFSAGQCAAPWQEPCSTSVDCGLGGFQCVQSGSLCDSSGCQATTSCVVPTLTDACTLDADCPAGWTCEVDTAVVTKCIPGIRHCPAQGCPAPTGKMQCEPPNWELVGNTTWTGPAPTPGTCLAVDGGADATGAVTSEHPGGSTFSCQVVPQPSARWFVLWAAAILLWVIRRSRKTQEVLARTRAIRLH